jgi:hypothetical protein
MFGTDVWAPVESGRWLESDCGQCSKLFRRVEEPKGQCDVVTPPLRTSPDRPDRAFVIKDMKGDEDMSARTQDAGELRVGGVSFGGVEVYDSVEADNCLHARGSKRASCHIASSGGDTSLPVGRYAHAT